jgi:hypothetical protein
MPNEFIIKNGFRSQGNSEITGSLLVTDSTNVSSFTASNATISGNVTVLGTASIGTLIVNQTQLSTGSNELGDAADDFQTLYGTVVIPTGSLTVTGSTFISSSNATQLQVGDNSLFVSSSGNVGIGTNNPTSRLQVSFPSNTYQSIFRSDAGDNLLAINTFPTTNRMQLLLGSYNGTATPTLASISDTDTGIQWSGGNIIRFVNGGSENVTINASGNVGIGTTTPTSRLQVRGSGTTSATTAFRVENANASTSMVVLDNGNVGIGTTAPSSSLHINTSSPVISLGVFSQFTKIYGANQSNLDTPSSTANSIVFQSNQTNNGYGFYFRQTNGGSAATWTSGTGGTLNLTSGGFIPAGSGNGIYKHVDIAYILNGTNGAQTGTGYGIYLNATETSLNGLTSALIDLRSNNTSRFTVLGTGNVGIGTTSPSDKLTVAVGNIEGIRVQSSNSGFVEVGKTGGARWRWANDYNTSNLFELLVNDLSGSVPGARVITVNGSNGNVGIGTVTPTTKLHVEGITQIKDAGNTAFYGGNYVRVFNDQNFNIRNVGGTTIANISVSGNSYFNGGNVGIGTTSPTSRLQVKGSGTTSATTAFRVENANASGSMVVLDNGNVGIGTNTPTHRLTVQGTTLVDSSVSAQGSFNLNPVTAPSAIGGFTLASGSSLGVGLYYYRVVYVTALGETNTSGPLTVTTTSGSTTVNLTGIPTSSDPRVTARKLYRTTVNNFIDNQRFLATINDNTTTTYTDTIPDASLPATSAQAYKVNTTSRYITTNGVQGMILDGNLTTLGLNAGAAIISANAASIRSVFIGASAGQSVTTGTSNTLIGGSAGGFLTTGGYNTLIGDLAGYVISNASSNVVIGAQTARHLTTGGNNTIVGTDSARVLADGTTQFTQGTENTILGRSIRMSTITDTNSIVIGSQAWSLGSNTAVLGNDSITRTALKGNVSVGTTGSISSRLHVKGSGTTSATTAFRVENANASGSMVVLDNGNVGIGTTSPDALLHISGASATNLAHFRGPSPALSFIPTPLAGILPYLIWTIPV